MSRSVEIIARYEGTRRVFGDPPSQTVIGSARLLPACKQIAKENGVSDPDEILSLKGEATVAELNPQSTYRFLGTFTNYYNKFLGRNERQFHFRTFVEHIPHDAAGIASYLEQAGRGNGIGPAKARKLVEHFGIEEVLEHCRTNPNEVSMVANIPSWQAEQFAELLNKRKATESTTIELDKLLVGRGFPKTIVRRLIKEFGNKAPQLITEDPYILMQFRGIGFRLCDKLYMELKLDPFALKRQALCLWYQMASDQSGNTWYQATEMIQKLRAAVGANADYKGAIQVGKELGQFDPDSYGAIATIRSEPTGSVLVDDGKCLWLAEGKVASQEERLAELIAFMMLENEDQVLTVYESEEVVQEFPATVLRCARCGRSLVADDVFVVDGKPYGPTCVEKI